jgi:hypothetical protein
MAPVGTETWAGQFPHDFTQEELFFLLEVRTLFPTEREFVALLGGDAAATLGADLSDAAGQHPSPEQRTTATVFERLHLPASKK